MMERTSNPILHRLQQTLETGAPREEIAKALEAAEQLGDELPPLLAYRAEERIAADRMLDRRRIGFGVGVAVSIFFAAVLAVGLSTLDRYRTANRDLDLLTELINQESWQEALDYFETLSPETRGRKEFVTAHQQVKEELDRDRMRVSEFKQLVDEIESDPTTEIDEVSLSRLKEIAKSEEELEIVANLTAEADEQRLMREAGRVQNQTQAFDQLQQEVDAFFQEQQESKVFDRARQTELQTKLQEFSAKNRLSNPDLAEAAKQTSALLTRERERADFMAQREQGLSNITNSVGNPDQFLKAVQAYVVQFPVDPNSEQLNALGGLSGTVHSTVAWINVLQDPTFQSPANVQSHDASDWLALVDQATKSAPGHALATPTLPLIAHYRAIVKRDEAIEEVRNRLKQPLLESVYRYPSDGGFLYSDQKPELDSPRAHVVEYFADLALNRETKNFGGTFKQRVLPQVALSGHCVYATNANKLVASMKQSDFTEVMYRLLVELKTLEESEIDPILQLSLLKELLQQGIIGSEPINHGFGDLIDSLAQSGFDETANWLQPDVLNENAKEARSTARKLLAGMNNWSERTQRMGESYREFKSARQPAPRWVGWVSSGPDSSLLARLKDQLESGEMHVVAVGQDTEPSLVSLGDYPEALMDSSLPTDRNIVPGSLILWSPHNPGSTSEDRTAAQVNQPTASSSVN